MAQTQLQRAVLIRERYAKLFAKLAMLRKDLDQLLDEAQNSPPEGASDGTIKAVQFKQLRGIEKATQELIVALLFDTWEK